MQVSGKKFLLVLASWLSFSSFCNAQDIQLTPNVITNNWSGAVVGGSISPGGSSGGSRPGYNPSTNTILFGYTQGSVEQNIIMSNVFENTGVRIYGYELSAHFMNSGYSRGTLGLTVTGRDAAGFPLQKDSYNIPSGNTANGEWGYFSTTRPYGSPFGLNSMQSMIVTATGKDDRYWAGYYGPQLRDVSFRIRYVADECKANPLYSLSCPGYEEAYLITQCNINALYSPSCAGYQQAYTNQQCSLNPLYSPTCPGYQNAYLNQQCSINPLYNTACTGYAEALLAQQCSINPLYNKTCPGYEQAFLAQQCSISSLYSPSCPGYAQALFTKTCNENQLSSPKCPLYEAAYLDQQCKVSQLFSTACPLYQKAFFDQQCAMSPLYNAACPGYTEAFRSKQIADACLTNPQSSPTCKGYVAPQQSVSTATVTTTVSSVILPGQDAIKSITQPQVTSDPIVNQVIQADGVKQEQSQQPQVQQPSSQRSTQQSTQRTSGGQEQRASSRTAQDARSRTQQAARRDAQQVQQDAAISSMAEVPGFSNYEQAKLPDVPFYKVEDIYKRVAITDNARALRQLNQKSDRIHKEMVDEQYRK